MTAAYPLPDDAQAGLNAIHLHTEYVEGGWLVPAESPGVSGGFVVRFRTRRSRADPIA
ncbi:MAG: hypothetical protein WAV45_09455 [Propionibacteriaceae bacterium]|nr:hypothetical protein [Micropruina sp.]